VLTGAYKTHLLALNVDLGPQDPIPDSLDKFVNVEYSMANSTVSHAQVRSISVSGMAADDPPDRWVRHMARYEYTVEIEFTDRVRCKPTDCDDEEDESRVQQTVADGSVTASPGAASDRPRDSGDSSSTEDSD
jgi:stonin-1/2